MKYQIQKPPPIIQKSKSINSNSKLLNKIFSLSITITTLALGATHALAQQSNGISLNGQVFYRDNIKYVLGDAKQAQIQNRLTSTAQINNLLDGFEELGVNGIRIAIFADGVNPNVGRYNEFYERAKDRGFMIFANPAEFNGGQRIANGTLSDIGPSVFNRNAATNALIDHIDDFTDDYDVDWVNPFNEDGGWSNAQRNTIYSTLQNRVNGATLIGPCTFGIPAAVSILENSNVGNFIGVETTHNLGFNHGSWPAFREAADRFGLEIWDSEVNHFLPNGQTVTRLESALDAGVEGLVLWNSWTTVNLNNGDISNAGITFRNLFSSGNTTEEYWIDVNNGDGANVRLSTTGNTVEPFLQTTGSQGSWTRWRFRRNTATGLWHLDRSAGGNLPRLRTDNSQFADMQATSSAGDWTQYEITPSTSREGAYYLTLPRAPSSFQRLRRHSGTNRVEFTTTNNQGGRVSWHLSKAD